MNGADQSTAFPQTLRNSTLGTYETELGRQFKTSKLLDRELQKSFIRHDSTLGPFDRWRNPPPKLEAASLEDIMNAVATSEQNELQGILPPAVVIPQGQHDAQSQTSSQASGSGVSSHSESSAYSFASKNSQGSFIQFHSGQSRRRRRRRTKPTSAATKPKKSSTRKRIFQCTFCTDAFATKYD
ncbi:uncharacterized protein BO97DRAFT_56632 [Aspergillus homomorphus CBS 101889]|uniref:C2H2-type domain-containing protein n=1 Tax=Aspergillus homomorphus (strain CBS 101889) TaxID=1450537 RepID=A0A395HYG0_ASPHC|nr:hypothetical protein BO97DRAFT_56632 [Aspergillus homomorphus CBS 101889]RAL12423.1 hypothetical protein BO97DRAFT_56632 [Aspergillus homomorphus CBS 101889]